MKDVKIFQDFDPTFKKSYYIYLNKLVLTLKLNGDEDKYTKQTA